MWNEIAWREIIHISCMCKHLFPCGIITLIHFKFTKYHAIKWQIVTFDVFRAYFVTLSISGRCRVRWIGRLMNDVVERKQRLCLIYGLSKHLPIGTKENNENRSQDSLYPSRDSNQTSPEHKPRALPIDQHSPCFTCSYSNLFYQFNILTWPTRTYNFRN